MVDDLNLQFRDGEEREKIKKLFMTPPSINEERPTIVFSTPSETGTSYFRLFEPMRAMYKKFSDEANFVYTEKLQPEHVDMADCILMHRCGELHSKYLNVARMWPKTEVRPLVIHDVDDNEFNLPATHPMKELWEQAGKDKMSVHSLKYSDYITTTTPKLKETFNNFNKNVSVFPNKFDWSLHQWNLDKEQVRREMLEEWFPTDDKIIIGWAGLTSHYADIEKMAPILKVIHDRYPNTHFIIAGLALKDSNVKVEMVNGKKTFKEVDVEDESKTYSGRVKALFNRFDQKRVKFFKALPLEEYGKFYSLFDISMAYIEHNTFNSCKSEIKVVESLRYGCPTIYSNFGGYRDFSQSLPSSLDNKRFYLKDNSRQKWVNALANCIDNLDESKKHALALRDYVSDIYNIDNSIEDHFYFIREKIEEHREKQVNNAARYMEI